MTLKIYTKTGDQGLTSLASGERVAKGDKRVMVYGDIDELSSHLGLVIALLNIEQDIPLDDGSAKIWLTDIQADLFVLASDIAYRSNEEKKATVQIESQHIVKLEQKIDSCSNLLPKLTNFILPGGHIIACHIHIARSICRRAERGLSQLLEQEKTNPLHLVYLNRLSDLLFQLARFANKSFGINEQIWKRL